MEEGEYLLFALQFWTLQVSLQVLCSQSSSETVTSAELNQDTTFFGMVFWRVFLCFILSKIKKKNSAVCLYLQKIFMLWRLGAVFDSKLVHAQCRGCGHQNVRQEMGLGNTEASIKTQCC